MAESKTDRFAFGIKGNSETTRSPSDGASAAPRRAVADSAMLRKGLAIGPDWSGTVANSGR
jgi:hypothetical protein